MDDEKIRDLMLAIMTIAIMSVCAMVVILSIEQARDHNKIFYQEAQMCQRYNAELWNNQNPSQIQCKDYLTNNTFYINRVGELTNKETKTIYGEATQ